MAHGFQLCAEFDGRIPVGCVAERKFDGILALWDGTDLWKRRGERATAKFPEVARVLPRNAVLLGEIVVFERGAMPAHMEDEAMESVPDDFGAVEGRVMRENPVDIRLGSRANPAVFVAFDLLAVDGSDYTGRPLGERTAALRALRAPTFHVWYPPQHPVVSEADLCALLARAVAEKWEGLVLKDVNTPYTATPPESKARPPHYLKFKLWEQRWFPILRWERTESGGFVVFVSHKGREQKIALGSVRLQEQVVAGAAKSVFVRFLIHGSEAAEVGAMRQATVRAVSHQIKEGTTW